MTELDIEGIVRIDEAITGRYQPEIWEKRLSYYIRRDPASSQVAEADGRIMGFMMGEVRGGEFGLEEPTGWLEFFGVDPKARGAGVGRQLLDALLAHFRSRGAKIVRTVVGGTQQDIDAFLKARGFRPAPLAILEQPLS